MHAIIDARSEFSFEKIYSIPVFERILRQLNEQGIPSATVIVSQHNANKKLLRNDFHPRYKIKTDFVVLENSADLFPIFGKITDDIMLFEGDSIYDERIIQKLSESKNSVLLKNKDNDPIAGKVKKEDISSLPQNFLNFSTLKNHPKLELLDLESIAPYVRFLRRTVPVNLIRLTDHVHIRTIENYLYQNTFKGSMEFVAVYGYRLPVREITRFLASTRITPNMITAIAIFSAFAAIPALALGWIWAGLLLAASFIFFDSVDGKLARMTIRYSHVADRFDHITSLPTRSAWYLSLTWHLSGNNLFNDNIGIAGMILTILPYLDKLNMVYFNAKFGKSLLDYTLVDRRAHLFTVRRNDIFFMLLSMCFGWIKEAFVIVVFWMIATWIWHITRIIYFLIKIKNSNEG